MLPFHCLENEHKMKTVLKASFTKLLNIVLKLIIWRHSAANTLYTLIDMKWLLNKFITLIIAMKMFYTTIK